MQHERRPETSELPALTPEVAGTHNRLRKLAHFLDTAIPLPGGYRIGADGLIGLVPVVGDFAGAAMSSYIVAEAHRLGAPPVLLARMVMNILVESAVGIVPVLGDLFDFAWKANRRNVQLLEQHLAEPRRIRRQSRWVVGAVTLGLLTAIALVVLLIFMLLRALIGAL